VCHLRGNTAAPFLACSTQSMLSPSFPPLRPLLTSSLRALGHLRCHHGAGKGAGTIRTLGSTPTSSGGLRTTWSIFATSFLSSYPAFFRPRRVCVIPYSGAASVITPRPKVHGFNSRSRGSALPVVIIWHYDIGLPPASHRHLGAPSQRNSSLRTVCQTRRPYHRTVRPSGLSPFTLGAGGSSRRCSLYLPFLPRAG